MNVWPFTPNWSSPVETASSFRTDIIVSRSGVEQRRSLRSTPRRSMSFSVTASGNQLRSFRRIMATQQNLTITMPDPTRRITATAITGTKVSVATVPPWLIAGAKVFVDDQVGTIATVSFDSFTVTTPLTAAVSLPASVRPALDGQIDDSLSTALPTNGIVTVDVKFDIVPASEPVIPISGSFDVLHGREVFALKPNWQGGISASHNWKVETVDVGFGVTETFRPFQFGTMVTKATFLENLGWLEAFHLRNQGQRGEFHMPTWVDDLPLKSTSGAGTRTIRVDGVETYQAYRDDPIYQTVAVFLHDGRRLYRQVSGMTTDAGDTIVTVDTPWLFNIAPEDVSMICWIPVSRLSSDDLKLEWLTNTVAQSQISMQTLPMTLAENPISEYDGAAQWVFENWRDTAALDAFDDLVNIDYPAIWYIPAAAVTWRSNQYSLDTLYYLVNVRYPEIVGG